MIIIINFLIMAGFIYFAVIGIRTTIHTRRYIKEQRKAAKRQKRTTQSRNPQETDSQPPVIDGGLIIGKRVDLLEDKRDKH